MNEQDNLLIERFFEQARQTVIDDDGFTAGVMRRLPVRSLRLSRLWTAFCIIMCVLLFTAGHGWHMLLAALLRVLTTPITPAMLLHLTIGASVIMTLILAELLHREHIGFRR